MASGSDDSSTTVVDSSLDTSEREWDLLEKEETRIKKLVSARQRSKDKEALRDRISELRKTLEDLDAPKETSSPDKPEDVGAGDGRSEGRGAESSVILDRRETGDEKVGSDRGHHRRRDDVSRAPYHHIIAPVKLVKLEPILLIKLNGIYRIKNHHVLTNIRRLMIFCETTRLKTV